MIFCKKNQIYKKVMHFLGKINDEVEYANTNTANKLMVSF